MFIVKVIELVQLSFKCRYVLRVVRGSLRLRECKLYIGVKVRILTGYLTLFTHLSDTTGSKESGSSLAAVYLWLQDQR